MLPAKRSHATVACASCRRRKIRCTSERPVCSACRSSDIQCTWGPIEQDARKPVSRRYVQSLKDRISSLEAQLGAMGADGDTGSLVSATSTDDGGEEHISSSILHLQLISQIGNDREEINCHNPSSAFAHLTKLEDHNPFANSAIQEDLKSGFRRYLPPPPAIELSPVQHDSLLELFFTFFSAWTLRTSPDDFRRDMFRVYSPFLHNAILSWALCLADEPGLRTAAARAPFVHLAERHLQNELDRPSLATAQGLGILSSVYSSLGRHTLGWSYMGLAERMVLSMGLNVSCMPLVLGGRISEHESKMRNHTFWTIFCQEQFWSIFIGRPHIPQRHTSCLPPIDKIADSQHWWANGPIEHAPVPGWTSTAFHHTCRLSLLIARVMTTLYSLRSDRAVLSSHTMTFLGIISCLVGMAPLSSEEMNVVIRRCDRSASRASALLDLYRSIFGLRFAVPFMMIATYIAGTTHLMASKKSRGGTSDFSASIRQAQECLEIMKELSATFTVAGRHADLLQAAIAIHQSAGDDVSGSYGDNTPTTADAEDSIMRFLQSILDPTTADVFRSTETADLHGTQRNFTDNVNHFASWPKGSQDHGTVEYQYPSIITLSEHETLDNPQTTAGIGGNDPWAWGSQLAGMSTAPADSYPHANYDDDVGGTSYS